MNIARLVSLALAAGGIASGCAGGAGQDPNNEAIATVEGAVCSGSAQDNAISAMFANLATAMAIEFKRMQFTHDLEIYRGAYNQEMLRVSSLSKSLCPNSSCKAVNAILAFQSATNKPYIFPNGAQLDPWTFASRLVAGFRAQATCEQRFWSGDRSACVTEWHYYDLVSKEPLSATCGIGDLSLARFKVSKADLYGRKLSPEQPLFDASKLQKMYLWTDQNQNLPVSGNPFMQFSVSSDGLYQSMDPGFGNYPNSGTSGSCPASLLKFSYMGITGACCSFNGGTRMWYQPYSLMSDGSGYWRCMNK